MSRDGRPLSEEHKTKLVEARQAESAQLEEWRNTIITIGDYQIYRFDSLNWAIKEKNNRECYFSSLEHLLMSLPEKLLKQQKYTELVQISEAIKTWKSELKGFIKFKLNELNLT